jgi:hypothetical protein
MERAAPYEARTVAPHTVSATPTRAATLSAFLTIPELAARWRCSRASVYNWIRGEKVFAPAPGRKGHKLVPLEVVLKIERERMKVLR